MFKLVYLVTRNEQEKWKNFNVLILFAKYHIKQYLTVINI